MPSLSEKILGATKRRYVDVPVVIDGEPFVIGLQSLTEKERSAFELVRDACKKDAEWNARTEDFRRRLIVECAVDPVTKEKLFGPLDLPRLENVDAAVLGALFDAAVVHVGFRRGDIEELVKNSGAAPADEPATN